MQPGIQAADEPARVALLDTPVTSALDLLPPGAPSSECDGEPLVFLDGRSALALEASRHPLQRTMPEPATEWSHRWDMSSSASSRALP